MKKLFYILALLMLTGCVEETGGERELREERVLRSISPFSYRGHDYILFRHGHTYNDGTVLHAPDCKKCVTIKRDSI